MSGAAAPAPLLELTWFPRVTEHGGRRFAYDGRQLEQWWRTAPTLRVGGKRELPVWCAALFVGDHRAKANVERVTAMVLDFDGVPRSLASIVASTPVACIGHTSWSHGRPEKPGHCFRLLLPLSRPISSVEHATLWAWLERVYARRGAAVDPSTKDASRAWFVPCAQPGFIVASALERPVLDVERALELAPPVRAEAPQQEARQVCGLGHATAPADVLERARRYLSRKEPAIAGAGGHRALWAAAAALTRGFALPESDALVLLTDDYNPRCKPPFTTADLARKVRETAKAERVGLGYLLEQTRARP